MALSSDQQGNNSSTLATQLFSVLCNDPSKKGENILISPISITQSLALIRDGATSESQNRAQLTKLLGDTSVIDPVRSLHKNTLEANASDEKNSGVKLTIATSLWADALNPSYIDLAKSAHFTEAFSLPKQNLFSTINQWVSDRTKGIIKHLFDPAQLVDPNMVAVLVNAVYFKGSWLEKFEESKTVDGEFYLRSDTDKETVLPARYMTASRRMEVIEHSNELGGASVLVLNYGQITSQQFAPEFSALFFLPADASDASMNNLVSGLGSQKILSLLGKVRATEVQLRLPRFKLKFGPTSLKKSLKQLGIIDAFDSIKSELFNQMTSDPRTYLDDILHGAAMEITEEGTVAAAATGATMKTRSIVIPFELNFNRPFVVAIVHRPTGLLLFIGRIEQPELNFESNQNKKGVDEL
jgi:serine protease inhibitor